MMTPTVKKGKSIIKHPIKDEKTFTTHFEDSDMVGDYCEWCGMEYPHGSWDYYELTVFGHYHKICSDCYDQLKKVK
jgi:hypothetical protein